MCFYNEFILTVIMVSQIILISYFIILFYYPVVIYYFILSINLLLISLGYTLGFLIALFIYLFIIIYHFVFTCKLNLLRTFQIFMFYKIMYFISL